MNEQLQNKAIEILTAMQTATEKAGSFAMEQLPDIAQSYIVYGRVSTSIWVVTGLLLFLAIPVVFYITYRKSKQAGFSDDLWMVPVFLGLGLGVISLTMLADNMKGFLMVWFAPKVWLLQELATLLK